MSVFERLVAFFTEKGTPFSVIEHEPEGRTEIISQIRGNNVDEAAKAMLMALQFPEKTQYVLAVIPGDKRIDSSALKKHFSCKKVSFAPLEDVEKITQCPIGAVPPLLMTVVSGVSLVIDDALTQKACIYFNAGRLDRSMKLIMQDFLSVVEADYAQISKA